jgi:hypothetical protein
MVRFDNGSSPGIEESKNVNNCDCGISSNSALHTNFVILLKGQCHEIFDSLTLSLYDIKNEEYRACGLVTLRFFPTVRQRGFMTEINRFAIFRKY